MKVRLDGKPRKGIKMENFEIKKDGYRNRQHAARQVLQLGAAGCRTCHCRAGLNSRPTGFQGMFIWAKKGQQIIEYALVITAITAALTVMYVYVKRGLQAAIKNKVDADIGPQLHSAPILSEREFSNMLSNMTDLTTESTRIQEGSGGARHVYDSNATASGNSIGCSGQVFVPTRVIDAE